MEASSTLLRGFVTGLTALLLAYFTLELYLNAHLMIAVDEFWFARHIFDYWHHIPYLDFAPYKTVLGYYLLLPPMTLLLDPINTLILTKDYIAALNTLILFASSLYLARIFSPKSILIALIVLLSSDIMLTYSTQIRVDLLGYWFCFAAILFLLNHRYLAAGLLMGLGFITTQKCIWYIASVNIALCLQWLLFQRNTKAFLSIALFNFTTASIIGLYLIGWSLLTSWSLVYHSVFTEASILYHLNSYANSRHLFWSFIATYNPLLFLLWPLTWFSLTTFSTKDTAFKSRCFIIFFTTTLFAFLIPYKQVFPYYMQVTLPAFFLLYTAFFSWLLHILKDPNFTLRLKPSYLIYLTLLYCLLVFISQHQFYLPSGYLLICLIPILLTLHLIKKQTQPTLIYLTLFFIGGIYAGILTINKMLQINNQYQQANLLALNALLETEDNYLAGIELIYNKTQPIPGMRHLDLDGIQFLYTPTPSYRNMMLASLDRDPNANIDNIIDHLKQANIKLYVNNYRMMAIPPAIKSYLQTEFTHYWGSLYLYAPAIPAGTHTFKIKFNGQYKIESQPLQAVRLNHTNYQTNQTLTLKSGLYTSQAKYDYRLRYIPASRANTSNEFKQDDWARMLN